MEGFYIIWWILVFFAVATYSHERDKDKKMDEGIQKLIDTANISNEKTFNKIVLYTTPYRYEVKSRSDSQIQLIKKKKNDINWLYAFTVGLLPYSIYYFIFKKPKIINITLDNENKKESINKLSVTDKIVKLANLLEKGHITKSEFDKEKQKLFK